MGGPPRPDRASGRYCAGPGRQRVHHGRAGGALRAPRAGRNLRRRTERVRGRHRRCQACGLGHAEVAFATGPASRPYGDFLTALGLTPGARPPGVSVALVVSWAAGVDADLIRAGAACTDAAATGQMAVTLEVVGPRLRGSGFAGGSWRTRCPGPLFSAAAPVLSTSLPTAAPETGAVHGRAAAPGPVRGRRVRHHAGGSPVAGAPPRRRHHAAGGHAAGGLTKDPRSDFPCTQGRRWRARRVRIPSLWA
jgi:hypothetical protein